MEKFSFLGTYDRKLDGKKRLNIPSAFIHQFGDDKRLILSRTQRIDYPVVAVFPSLLVYSHNMNSYFGFDEITSEVDDYWNSLSETLFIDGAGRITLNHIPEFAQVNDVTVFGRRSWFEIWDAENFKEYDEKIKSLRK